MLKLFLINCKNRSKCLREIMKYTFDLPETIVKVLKHNN